MSHHCALGAGAKIVENSTSPDGSLWNEMKSIFAGRLPAFWYWGHLHNGFAYKALEGVLCRCIGNSAMPNGVASDAVKAKSKFEYYADTKLSKKSNLVLNQFAILTIDDASGVFKEEFYNVGQDKPVWTKINKVSGQSVKAAKSPKVAKTVKAAKPGRPAKAGRPVKTPKAPKAVKKRK